MKKLLTPLALFFAVLWLSGAVETRAQLTPEMEGSKIMKRFTSFKYQRMPNGVLLPENVRSEMIDVVRRQERAFKGAWPQEQQPVWKSVGPRSTAGRMKSIVIHPEITDWIYAAAAAGGVWKSSDAGATWTPIMDDANAIAMGSLWFDPEDASVLYAGTGEQVTNANTYLGAGLLKTTNDGASWEVVGLTHVGSISRVYVHPKQPNLIMVAAMNTNGGVYRSLDKGKTFTKLLDGNVYDMSINPNNENEWFINVQERGFLYSSNQGDSWQARNNGLFGAFERGSIQQCPTNANIVYCLIELNNLARIAKSTNKGLSWVTQYADNQGCFFSARCDPDRSQGFYDNYIAVSPHDENVAFAGGIDIWRTTNGGATWVNITDGYADGDGANPVHVDQHCLIVHPNDPQIVYAGNDGGMWKSRDGGTRYSAINNGLTVTQFYSFSSDMSRPDRIFGGTQDNGTLGSITNPVEWDTINGGDGMSTKVSWSNPDIVYGSNPNGVHFRIDFGDGPSRYITSGLDMDEEALWVTPLTLHPFFEKDIFTGRKRVWRSNDQGDFWFAVSPEFLSSVSVISYSKVDPFVVWAASSTGEILVSEEDTEEWRALPRTGLSNNFVTDIAPSTTNRETAFLSYGTYGTINLWKTTDLGETWQPLWKGMPNVPVNKIAVHPDNDNILFLATDVGVYATFNGGESWMPYGTGLPRSPALDIEVSSEHNFVRVGTHGRSIWETELVSNPPTDPVVTAPLGGDVFTGSLETTISWHSFTEPVDLEYSVNDGASWNPIRTNVTGTDYRWKLPNWPTETARVRVTSVSNPSQQVVSRTFTIQTINKGDIVQQASLPWSPYGLAYDGKNGLWSSSFYKREIAKVNATTLTVEKVVPITTNVGDSLFTDLTMDRTTGLIYLHRLNNSNGLGGVVIVLDTNGNVVNQFTSAARRFPTGLELVNNTLIAGERDVDRNLYVTTPSGEPLSEAKNPFDSPFGPRSLSFDGSSRLFQTCTQFTASGDQLLQSFILEMSVNNLSEEVARLPLKTADGPINARGIDFDPRDKNFWIADFNGNIYKITGFDFVPPAVTSIDETTESNNSLQVFPNPAAAGSVTVTINASGVISRLQPAMVSIVDLKGQTVVEQSTEFNQGSETSAVDINVRELASGTYRVVVSQRGTVFGSTLLAITR